jgi:hypothetical protein
MCYAIANEKLEVEQFSRELLKVLMNGYKLVSLSQYITTI